MSSWDEAPDTSTTPSPRSPDGRPLCDPTTPEPSPVPQRHATSSQRSGTSSPAAPQIRYSDRIFVSGITGSGKSELVNRLTLAAPAPRLIIDPKNEALTAVPGAVTFNDVSKATNPAGQNWREAATARYVPRDPLDGDEYDELYRWVMRSGPRYVACHEVGFVMPARGAPRGPRLLLTQGRARQIGHVGAHTRPREVDSNMIAQSRHLFVFHTPQRPDRRHLAESMGIDADVFEAAHAELVRFGFLYWDLERQRLRICPPLKL